MTQEIRVWDPLVRIFHWSLVLAFTIGYLTGEEESNWHIYSGYAVLGLISFRVLWGFIGTRHARFSDFMVSPGTAVQYLKELRAQHPQRYIGHNPAGGWMIMALLATLFVVSISGLKVYAIEEGLGPLAGAPSTLAVISVARADDDDDSADEPSVSGHSGESAGEEFWEEIHEASANFMLLLIFLHVAGVIVSGRLHHENLIRAMFTGKKSAGSAAPGE